MTAEAPVQNQIVPLPTTHRRIVLTGFMGAGKSSVGALLAQHLGWRFLDLDAHVESRTGISVAEIFAQQGEARFRRLESAALANALRLDRVVLALGGGTPEFITNRLLLEQTPGTVVAFLQAPFTALYDRCMLQQFSNPTHVRPVLSSPAEAEARFRLREPIYRRVSRVHLDTGRLTTAEAAIALATKLTVPSVA